MDDLALRLFKLSSAGYCCTQIMVKMALEDEESENDDLLRAVNGFCKGIAGQQKTCGVLTGAIAVMGLYAGKGKDIDRADEQFGSMMQTYMEWFEKSYESMDCQDLIGVTHFDEGDQNYAVKCGDIMMESYVKIIEILEENGYDYGERGQE